MMGPAAVDVDGQISQYLQIGASKNFFLYAGAGSGKTSSLITALMNVRAAGGEALQARGSKIAVITYTNAATEEIRLRLGDDSLVHVSTIHSFAWKLVKDFPADIAAWLDTNLIEENESLRQAEAKGRAGTKASAERLRKIARNERVRAELPEIRRFNYSPSQTRPARGGLSHAQVLRVAAYLLLSKPVFQQILVGRYPILLVDEVQDTNKDIMTALLAVTKSHERTFTLGLFGDTMQRIYADGKTDLEESLTQEWGRPEKLVNYRSSKRIVDLINQIRSDADGRTQAAVQGAAEGQVRLFLAAGGTAVRGDVEGFVLEAMAAATGDEYWLRDGYVKTLLLEHAMAAERLGFVDFLEAFSGDSDVKSAVMSRESIQGGTVHFLGSQVLPLAKALRSSRNFEADRLLRSHSPLLRSEATADTEAARGQLVQSIRSAVLSLSSLWSRGEPVVLGAVIREVADSGLLELPDELQDVLALDGLTGVADLPPEGSDQESPTLLAWGNAMAVDFDQFERYYEYVVGRSNLDTHQGVKGLEFPRVCVILDDLAAKGFLFNYGKLFNATPLSATDLSHVSAGEESTLDRTRRLFYVACSRARSSLAVVLYADDLVSAQERAVEAGWFTEAEVVIL